MDMDERIRQGYCKIYSELFGLILILAALSVVINVAFFHKDFTQLWFEYIILVGSPIYRLVRSKMLEISDSYALEGKRGFHVWLVKGILASGSVFLTIEYIRFGKIDFWTVVVFFIPFVICFCLTAVLVRKLQVFWKKKLDERYGDEE